MLNHHSQNSTDNFVVDICHESIYNEEEQRAKAVLDVEQGIKILRCSRESLFQLIAILDELKLTKIMNHCKIAMQDNNHFRVYGECTMLFGYAQYFAARKLSLASRIIMFNILNKNRHLVSENYASLVEVLLEFKFTWRRLFNKFIGK